MATVFFVVLHILFQFTISFSGVAIKRSIDCKQTEHIPLYPGEVCVEDEVEVPEYLLIFVI